MKLAPQLMNNGEDVERVRVQATKRSAAAEQLDDAIAAMFADRLASAITLAGAAESILPDLPNSNSVLFHGMRNAGAERFNISQREMADRLNEARNWLKHAGEPPELTLCGMDALTMVLRAYTKFTVMYGDDAATPTMLEFERWFRANYPGL